MPNCDYDTSRGYSASEGLGCYKGKAVWRVTIFYEPYGIDTDELKLCDQCFRRLKTLCRKHGYKVQAVRLFSLAEYVKQRPDRIFWGEICHQKTR